MNHIQKILMTTIFVAMFALLLVIVFGDNGVIELNRLRGTHRQLISSNAVLTQENIQLYRTIERLQNDPAFVENVARRELGMIRSNEIIFKFETGQKTR